VIVGWGTNPAGKREAWLAEIPQSIVTVPGLNPAGLLVAILSMVAAGSRYALRPLSAGASSR
jgi:hypothetical protein